MFAGDYHKFFDMGLQTKDIQLMADIAKASNVSLQTEVVHFGSVSLFTLCCRLGCTGWGGLSFARF